MPDAPDDPDLYQEFLTLQRGGRVRVRVPQRGAKRQLLETVTQNAHEAFARHKLRRASDHNARARALVALQEALGLPEAPLRIECYDISNLQGTEIVASMVVMEDGLPKRSDYRRFKMRHQPGQDDFASMEEVLTRRFRRYLQDRDEGARSGKRFAYPPNLVLIDGGKGQLGVAVRVLEEMGLEDIAVASLAKRFEEVYLPGESEPVRIPRDSEALYLLQQVRDEAHRFAITFHRQLARQEDDPFGARRRARPRSGPPRPPAQGARLGQAAARAGRRRSRGDPVAPRSGRARPVRTAARRKGTRVTLDVTIITGMSGAGRSASADVLEDLGFFVIDNLPPALVAKVAELGRGAEGPQKFALVIDVRSGEFVDDLVAALAELREMGASTRVLFLDAADDVLVRRYEATRRKHPARRG